MNQSTANDFESALAQFAAPQFVDFDQADADDMQGKRSAFFTQTDMYPSAVPEIAQPPLDEQALKQIAQVESSKEKPKPKGKGKANPAPVKHTTMKRSHSVGSRIERLYKTETEASLQYKLELAKAQQDRVRELANAQQVLADVQAGKRTRPRELQFSQSKKTDSPVLTSEEREALRLQEIAAHQAKLRKISEQRMQQALNSPNLISHAVVRSTAALTEAHSPVFNQSKRPRAAATNADESAGEMVARMNRELPERFRRSRVVPSQRASSAPPVRHRQSVAPKFQTDLRAQMKAAFIEPVEPHAEMPLGELCQQMESELPSRFRAVHNPSPTPFTLHERTIPKPPALSSDTRARPLHKSSDELEKEALAALPKLHARPLDKAVLDGTAAGLPEISKRALTVPKELPLATATREREPNIQQLPPLPKARPMPKFPEPVQPTADKASLTSAVSPQLHTKARASIRPIVVELNDPVFKGHTAKPMPEFPSPPKASSARSPTKPNPFNLATEERGHQHTEKFKQMIDEENEQLRKRRMLTAQPMPIGEPFIPKPSEKPLTMAKDLGLHTEERGKKHEGMFQLKLQMEEEQMRRAREIHARDASVLQAEPFIPKPSARPLTEIRLSELNSDRRAVKRKVFDDCTAAKMEAQAKLEAEMAEKQRLIDEEELKQYRTTLVCKARPVPMTTYEPPVNNLPITPLTEAITPDLATAKRARTREVLEA